MTDQVNIPFSCLQGIWNKLGELLSTAGSIVSAPGHCPEARLVLSRSGKRPHLVLPSKAGFKCDSDCVNFKSLGICSHTVVVAHINDQLPQFVSNLKKAKKQPNLTQLAVHEMPAGVGKKGARPSRKRKRKPSIEGRQEFFSSSQNVASTVNVTIDSGTCFSPIIQ